MYHTYQTDYDIFVNASGANSFLNKPLFTFHHLKSYCSEIQHRLKPAVYIQHTILS